MNGVALGGAPLLPPGAAAGYPLGCEDTVSPVSTRGRARRADNSVRRAAGRSERPAGDPSNCALAWHFSLKPASAPADRIATRPASPLPGTSITQEAAISAELPIQLPAPVDDWVGWLRDIEIPVLRSTISALRQIGADEDKAAPNEIASVVLADPLMTLKVLKYLSANRTQRIVTEAKTVTASILLIGIERFFREFGQQTSVEDLLVEHPLALRGLKDWCQRAHRAAMFSLAFAVHRVDHDAELLHEAALLHDFTEALVWCHAPEHALEMQRRQRADPALRSASVQRELLGVELIDLEQALMHAWQLPEPLIRFTDDHRSDDPRVLNVMLAIRLARHSQHGWHNPALPDDFTDIGMLLNLTPAMARQKVMRLDR